MNTSAKVYTKKVDLFVKKSVRVLLCHIRIKKRLIENLVEEVIT